MSRLFAYLTGLRDHQFFGEVRLVFHRGQLRQIRVEQSFVEENLPATSTFEQDWLTRTPAPVEERRA